jgi:opacity protein-like surface antigen
MRRIVAVALFMLGLLALPSTARADWLLTPFLGVSFGGDADGQHVTYGGSIGYMGAGVVGFEVDFSHAPEFLDELLFPESSVTSFMGNVIVGVPIGGSDASVRPYATGGVGLLRTSVSDIGGFFDIDNNSFGINVGAGVMVFVNDRVGIRGDLRYLRALQDPEEDDEFDIDFGSFDFWRGTVGVTFKF